MARRRIVWHLFGAWCLVIVASTVLGAWSLSSVLEADEQARTEADLLSRARLVAGAIGGNLDGDPSQLRAVATRLGQESGTRITLQRADGVVLADSEAETAAGENHGAQPEIQQALASRDGVGRSARPAATPDHRLLYVALRLGPQAAPAGTVRVALPLTEVAATTARLRHRIYAGAGVALLLAAGVGLAASRVLSRPLEEVRLGAERFASGDFSQRLPVGPTREVAAVAEALNHMADQLSERVQTIERQAGEREAILSSMDEGVLAVDAEERVISLNAAAGEILGAETPRAVGRILPELLRHPELERLVARVLRGGPAGEVEVQVVAPSAERLVEVRVTPLRGAGAQHEGAVLVLQDLTRLRRLETMRRDFVANVSHELKTPITSIKGFVETLRTGALRDPERAQHFLSIVARQADRLSAIMEDLLTLSRLERGADATAVVLERGPVRPVLESAVQACEPRAADKGLALEVSCPSELAMPMNAPLLEQALVNLIGNAIQHGGGSQPVRIGAEPEDTSVVISVADQGRGIEAEHIPRLFERFYRVDRARSRSLGGTGLGLAIVKHIAQAHGGTVDVESWPGTGSTFRMRLPA